MRNWWDVFGEVVVGVIFKVKPQLECRLRWSRTYWDVLSEAVISRMFFVGPVVMFYVKL